MFEKLIANSMGLSRRFPDGDEPFQVMTRLLEEAGELAQQVNHFQDSGIKRAKYGRPNKANLAKEVQDVLCVIDREAGGVENLAGENLNLHALFTLSELRTATG